MSELMEISLLALAVPTLDIASCGARTGIIVIYIVISGRV
jgi:hypothetical protein